jgi:cation:H+ antiporter
MILDLVYVAIGLVLLYYGAEWLVKGAVSAALRTGLSRLIIGLTVVAFGTSAPEMAVSVKAAFAGSADIALGNIIGSNISNIGLILGLVVLIQPLNISRQVFKFDAPIAIWTTVLLIFLLINREITRLEGVSLVGLLVLYVFQSIRISRRTPDPHVLAEVDEDLKASNSTWIDAGLIAVGIVVMLLGADRLVAGAVSIAKALEVPEAIIGLTMVALGTSLPELATSVVAALKKEADIAVGNIIGSNIFNILSVLGFSAAIHPIHPTGEIDAMDLGVMLFLAVIILPLGWKHHKLVRWHGALLFGTYVFYMLSLGGLLKL